MTDNPRKPGSFCTSVLRTRNPERAAAFYTAVLGWTTSANQFQYAGKTVAHLHRITAGRSGNSGNDVWVPHVSVPSLERTTADAIALGATPIDSIDIPGFARLATLSDLEDATFGLWESNPNTGAEIMEGVGSLWWIEVLSHNPALSGDFYGKLFGWTTMEKPLEPFPSYTYFKRGEQQEGGLLPIGSGWDVSPIWNSIFSVADADATISLAQTLGAREIFTHTVPSAGRIGSLIDPNGATFVVRGPVPK